MTQQDSLWWRGAAIYQVYVRSFADGDGDGTGDLAGVRSRLPYLADLGIDAIWFNPWYPSPMDDGGYDVSDYRDIEPSFGSLAEAEKLIEEAHTLGIKIIIDIVPNHCSDEHPWFAAALAAGPGSPERERFWFRDGRGEGGELPPNNWQSRFGGSAWTRVTQRDGTPGQWFLHLYSSRQPDLNWTQPGRARRVRGHPAVLVQPRRRRLPHRRRRRAGQGGRAAGRRRPGGPAAVLGPGRRARDLPGVAQDRGLVPGQAGVRRRDVAARPAAVRHVPAARRAALGVQLRLPVLPVGRDAAA